MSVTVACVCGLISSSRFLLTQSWLSIGRLYDGMRRDQLILRALRPPSLCSSPIPHNSHIVAAATCVTNVFDCCSLTQVLLLISSEHHFPLKWNNLKKKDEGHCLKHVCGLAGGAFVVSKRLWNESSCNDHYWRYVSVKNLPYLSNQTETKFWSDSSNITLTLLWDITSR